MEIGTSQHKQEFLHNLTKTYQENIWISELGILEFENLLGSLRKQRAEADLKLENKEFKSAGEGRKETARLEADIESTQAAIARKHHEKQFAQKRIDLIKQYQA